ncbi:Ank3 [Symbiodinium sp. CCMP2592]|nr:Ank3 [Symbiodinium sp. CCMP2592]
MLCMIRVVMTAFGAELAAWMKESCIRNRLVKARSLVSTRLKFLASTKQHMLTGKLFAWPVAWIEGSESKLFCFIPCGLVNIQWSMRGLAVHARWAKDMVAMEDSIKLMLSNRLQDAEDCLDSAAEDVSQRDFLFDAGDHDMRGCFTFVSALMSLLNGLASLENNQLDIVLQRVRNADEELTKDEDWPGKTVLRGLCNLVAGVVEIMQGMPSRGVWHVLRSWLWLRNLEVEALNYEGHERCCVRSTALLALGVFNLHLD